MMRPTEKSSIKQILPDQDRRIISRLHPQRESRQRRRVRSSSTSRGRERSSSTSTGKERDRAARAEEERDRAARAEEERDRAARVQGERDRSARAENNQTAQSILLSTSPSLLWALFGGVPGSLWFPTVAQDPPLPREAGKAKAASS